ncbi:hypothetical protein BofuT4_uP079390.1 [Botrytis cinerea T4]|uniref:Uncharacterized protein n=1 Tax=Botryotinia fuckeliana (strain T4) TaxID=999810 RepID=G2YKJ6_BOTF4|nr:hypothetical protein BofuT4_uP079390.1 [Botrytis cinerea T4]
MSTDRVEGHDILPAILLPVLRGYNAMAILLVLVQTLNAIVKVQLLYLPRSS